MAASEYCQPADLHDHGLPRGTIPNPGRLVAAVYPDSSTLELDEHGYRLDAPLVFRAEEGGELFEPAEAGTTYYAIPLTDSTFQIAASPGGSALSILTEGSSIVVSTALPKTAAIQWASGVIDDALIGHQVQLTAPYPITVVAVCAQLAIAKLLSYSGTSSQTLAGALADAQKQLEKWARGVPVRGAIVPSSANLAVAQNVTPTTNWGSQGETIP